MGLIKLRLPPKGTLVPTGDSDPLEYYYKPLVGRLYVNRIDKTLGLLSTQSFSRILEIGYGSGILMPTLCRLSDDVHGVDLDSDPELVASRLASLGCYPKLSRGQPDLLLFEDNSCELVITISVLEHIKEIDAFLKEIYRVIKPGGYLLVGMPAVNKTMEYLFQLIGFSGIDHHHVTTPEEMQQAARRLFQPRGTAWLPGFMPSNLYLYKSFYFQK
jgi:ubiquinone/menaquinone biosynthesis C-methylase UbiE